MTKGVDQNCSTGLLTKFQIFHLPTESSIWTKLNLKICIFLIASFSPPRFTYRPGQYEGFVYATGSTVLACAFVKTLITTDLYQYWQLQYIEPMTEMPSSHTPYQYLCLFSYEVLQKTYMNYRSVSIEIQCVIFPLDLLNITHRPMQHS